MSFTATRPCGRSSPSAWPTARPSDPLKPKGGAAVPPVLYERSQSWLLDKFSTQRNHTKHDTRSRITPAEDPTDAAALDSYNLTDIAAESEASATLSPTDLAASPHERTPQ